MCPEYSIALRCNALSPFLSNLTVHRDAMDGFHLFVMKNHYIDALWVKSPKLHSNYILFSPQNTDNADVMRLSIHTCE